MNIDSNLAINQIKKLTKSEHPCVLLATYRNLMQKSGYLQQTKGFKNHIPCIYLF
jgi:hypothetical protein